MGDHLRGQPQQASVSLRLHSQNIRPGPRPMGTASTANHIAPRPPVYNQLYFLPRSGISPVPTQQQNMIQMRTIPASQPIQHHNGTVPVMQHPGESWNDRYSYRNHSTLNHPPPPPYHRSQHLMNGAVFPQSTPSTVPVSNEASSNGATKLVAFLKQLLELSQKSVSQGTHSAVVRLVQQLVNREVTPEVFCRQLQANLKSGNSKMDLEPFIDGNIDYLRCELYHGKHELPDIKPPAKEMIVDLLSTTTPQTTAVPVHPITLNSFPRPVAVQSSTQRVVSTPPITRFTAQPTIAPAPPRNAILSQGTILHPSTSSSQPIAQPKVLISPNRLIAPNSSGLIRTATVSTIPTTATPTHVESAKIASVSSLASNLVRPSPIAAKTTMSTPALACKPPQSIVSLPVADQTDTSVSANDQPFFPMPIVKSRIIQSLSNDVQNVSDDAASCMSHGLHLFTKYLLVRLGIVVQHRTERLLDDPRLVQTDFVRDKLTFLQRLDEHDQMRQSDMEKELIFKAARVSIY